MPSSPPLFGLPRRPRPVWPPSPQLSHCIPAPSDQNVTRTYESSDREPTARHDVRHATAGIWLPWHWHLGPGCSRKFFSGRDHATLFPSRRLAFPPPPVAVFRTVTSDLDANKRRALPHAAILRRFGFAYLVAVAVAVASARGVPRGAWALTPFKNPLSRVPADCCPLLCCHDVCCPRPGKLWK